MCLVTSLYILIANKIQDTDCVTMILPIINVFYIYQSAKESMLRSTGTLENIENPVKKSLWTIVILCFATIVTNRDWLL